MDPASTSGMLVNNSHNALIDTGMVSIAVYPIAIFGEQRKLDDLGRVVPAKIRNWA